MPAEPFDFIRLNIMNYSSGDVSALGSDVTPVSPPVCPQPETLEAAVDSDSLSPHADANDKGTESATIESETSADNSAWRDELSARLTRYRARRKPQPPRYPSLNIKFDPSPNSHTTDAPHSSLVSFEPLSDRSLALDGIPPFSSEVAAASAQTLDAFLPAATLKEAPTQPAVHSSAHSGAKIIEFPRFAWAPPPAPLDQLAEPVITRPRILEVPEFAPPPPALGGITIEPAEREEDEKRPGIDFPLQTASVVRRMVANAVDAVIVMIAAASFGFIFWKVAAIRPPMIQTLELAAAIPTLFWAIYQYLLIVYSGSTPGLRAAGLELARFDGSTTSRSLRRWRVIASYLSAASLGMGYAWVLLDEDSLCWHDRATRTYLAPKRPL